MDGAKSYPGCLKKIVAIGILVFDFELFIGDRFIFTRESEG